MAASKVQAIVSQLRKPKQQPLGKIGAPPKPPAKVKIGSPGGPTFTGPYSGSLAARQGAAYGTGPLLINAPKKG